MDSGPFSEWYSICDYSSHHSPSDECQGPRFAAFVTRRVTSTLSNASAIEHWAPPRIFAAKGGMGQA